MSERQGAWTIHQLVRAMQEDLKSCHTETERQCCEAICRKEIREKAEEFTQSRKLNPGELAIAQECGYNGPAFNPVELPFCDVT